jgi:hypothetical protein
MTAFDEHSDDFITRTEETFKQLKLFKEIVKVSCEKRGLYPWLNPDTFLDNWKNNQHIDTSLLLRKIFDCSLSRLQRRYSLDETIMAYYYCYVSYSQALRLIVNNEPKLQEQVVLLRQELLQKVAQPLPDDGLEPGFYLVRRPHWDWNRGNDSNVKPYVCHNQVELSHRVEPTSDRVSVYCPISAEFTDVDENTFLGKVDVSTRWTISAGMGEPVPVYDPQEIVEKVSNKVLEDLDPLTYGGFQLEAVRNGYDSMNRWGEIKAHD